MLASVKHVRGQLDELDVLEAVEPTQRRGSATPRRAAITIESRPPTITAGTAPIAAAATPDSKAPSSFEPPMNTRSTAPTRPRISGGVEQRLQARPDQHAEHVGARERGECQRARARSFARRRRRTVKTPYSATTMNSVGPTRRRTGRTESTRPTTTAPAPGAARRIPFPSAPTCRTSLEKTGRSAVAPPNSTAARSSEIAPSRARRGEDQPDASERVPERRWTRLGPDVRATERARHEHDEGGGDEHGDRASDVGRRVRDLLGEPARGRPEHARGLPGDGAHRDDARQRDRDAPRRRAAG